MKTKSIMIVGVGGQGSLLASRLLGNVLLAQGYDVKVSEVHGMSQRGGSVVTYVRYGDKVLSKRERQTPLSPLNFSRLQDVFRILKRADISLLQLSR